MKKLFLALFVVLALGMMSTSVWAQWWEIDVEAMVTAVPPGDLPPSPFAYPDAWEDADTAPGLLVRVGMDVYFVIVATNDTDYLLWLYYWVVPDSLLMSGIHIQGLIPIGGIQDPEEVCLGTSDSLLEVFEAGTAIYNSGETETHLMGVLGEYEYVPEGSDEPVYVLAYGDDYVNYTAVYEACSHGFWKNHPEEWEGLDYSPSDLIVDVFTSAGNFVGDDTLMDALEYKGGRGLDGAARILLRQGVAALLNEALDADDDNPWDYPYDYPDGVIAEVNLALDAIAGETEKEHRRRILDLSEKLEGYNNGLCPLEGDD